MASLGSTMDARLEKYCASCDILGLVLRGCDFFEIDDRPAWLWLLLVVLAKRSVFVNASPRNLLVVGTVVAVGTDDADLINDGALSICASTSSLPSRVNVNFVVDVTGATFFLFRRDCRADSNKRLRSLLLTLTLVLFPPLGCRDSGDIADAAVNDLLDVNNNGTNCFLDDTGDGFIPYDSKTSTSRFSKLEAAAEGGETSESPPVVD